jgi:hypothetical protein
MEVSGQFHATPPPGEIAPDIHWIGGFLNPRASLDAVAKIKNSLTLPGQELENVSCFFSREDKVFRLFFKYKSILDKIHQQ